MTPAIARADVPSSTSVFVTTIVLVVITAGVYAQSLTHEFINFDDPSYVTDNPHVQQGLTWPTVCWAFTSTDFGNWHPLTWLSHGLDYQLFGLHASGHHAMSLLWHVANVSLLFLALVQMTGSIIPSALVAALFGVHPLHVESVAWVAERKDVLSTFFWMLTLLAYVRYMRRPGVVRYFPVLIAFALGLMCKPMLVTLPAVLLFLDHWPLGRGRRVWLIAEKIPLFVLAAVSSIVTFIAQRAAGSVISLASVPLGVRCANALHSYVTYMWETLWPVDLAIFYPYTHDLSPLATAGASVILAAITVLAIRQASARPYVLVGWLWYVTTLLPVVGIVQVGDQALADRYTYVPLIGLFIVLAWGGSELFAKRAPAIGASVAIAAVASCLVATWYQLRLWRDSETLFAHAVQAVPGNDVAHLNLGVELQRQGRSEEAQRQFTEALRIRPDYAAAHNNLGLALASVGDLPRAVEHYRAAVSMAPRYVDAHYNLAHALAQQGRRPEAAEEYAAALRISPDDAQAHNNLGMLLSEDGDLEAAIDHFRHALRVNPRLVEAEINLGAAYKARGDLERAIAEYVTALKIDPDSALAHNNLANALSQQSRFDEAVAHYAEALRVDPAYAEAQFNWGNALAQQGKFAEAIAHYKEALRIAPGFADARRTLARAQAVLNSAE